MALRQGMSTRDPQRAAREPEHVREFDSRTGGYTKAPADRPVPGTPNGTGGRLRGGR
ncbi:hypothetical protein ACFYXD_38050 [Streptomyces platensis]|uniref:hypothetical protein n=1 Tax=Streptomyces platensis TaxID=58346 RepID=UPI00367E1B5C